MCSIFMFIERKEGGWFKFWRDVEQRGRVVHLQMIDHRFIFCQGLPTHGIVEKYRFAQYWLDPGTS